MALCGTVRHCAALYGTVGHCTALCGTVRHCAALYGTVRPDSRGGFHVQLRLGERSTFCELCPTGQFTAALLCITVRCAVRTVHCTDICCYVLMSRVACHFTYVVTVRSAVRLNGCSGNECKELQEWERLAFCF
jgi:hypothetical protein